MTRTGPFSPRGRFGDPFSVMRQEFGRMAEDLSRMAATAPGPAGSGPRMALARVDMSETEDALEIEIEAPGVEERGLDVSLRGDVLTVRAVRDEHERAWNDRTWHVRERASAGVTRTITLPFAPDPGALSAHLAHGVLHIHAPKAREPAQRSVRIPIRSAAPTSTQDAQHGEHATERGPRPTGSEDGPRGSADPAI